MVPPCLKLTIQDQSGNCVIGTVDEIRSGNQLTQIIKLPPNVYLIETSQIVYANSPAEHEATTSVQQPAIEAPGYRRQNEIVPYVDPNSFSEPVFEDSDNVDDSCPQFDDDEMVELTPCFSPGDEIQKPDVFSEEKAIQLIKALGNAKQNEFIPQAGTYIYPYRIFN